MDARRIVLTKYRRLSDGRPIRVLDLFSGCGGLSLGFKRAGYDIVAAVEIDPHASESHARNFCPLDHPKFASFAATRDITQIEPPGLFESLKIRSAPENSIDVIVGGPPCQAFARVGRAKLREIDQHPEAFLRDPRSNLYLRYLHYVRELLPLAILMENVPDVMNFGGHNVVEEVCDVLSDIGYVCGYTLLNAAFYGVPQMRERMFLIAYRSELNLEVLFPEPSHWLDLPSGYSGTRHVALRVLNSNGHRGETSSPNSGAPIQRYYKAPPPPHQTLHPAVTTEEAIRDLPVIMAQQLSKNGQLRRGVRRFTEFVTYRHDIEPSQFAIDMRLWPGFESKDGVHDHVIRSLPRDYPIFAQMQPGDQYPEAYEIAHRLCDAERRRRRIARNSPEDEALQAAMVPPYDPTKFPNKWRKLEAFLPSRTLLAHIGKDTYSHIHYDDAQARTISVREAARLQSFPDGFSFAGTMNPAFRQIGKGVTAIPPSGGGVIECRLFSLDAVFDKIVPFTV